MSLPLFVDLTDRLVVVVGGGPVAARRVRTFLGEGAAVRVVAPWVCEDLKDLLLLRGSRYQSGHSPASNTSNREVGEGDGGRVEWLERDYAGPEDLTGAWLVQTCTGDALVDASVVDAAAVARVWCVDATSGATTPAAVGARTEVETPDGTVTVAAHAGGDPRLAASIRDGVATSIANGRIPLQRTRPRNGAGWVALVGGGPGSDGLLTGRGHELLASADVVVTDRLAPRGVVDRLPASVRVIDVGKTPGHHPVPQSRINDILVEEAQRGHAVVRLKGGDPYVLGRGGEERLACVAHGIPVEVVPGVTSAISVPAAAGIPVTHRGVARGFTLVTGHEDIADVPSGGDHTLVLLMGVSHLERTAELLVAGGRSAECPVAIVERGWSPSQRTTVGTLTTIAATARDVGVEAPAVIVVGDVVRLSPHWT